MAVNERQRVSLYESARETWNEEDAETLLKSLPHPAADLATKRDIVALRGELRGEIRDLRGDMESMRGELRGDMEGMRGELRGEIKDLRGEMLDRFRAQTMWFSGALVAGMGVAASIGRFA